MKQLYKTKTIEIEGLGSVYMTVTAATDGKFHVCQHDGSEVDGQSVAIFADEQSAIEYANELVNEEI